MIGLMEGASIAAVDHLLPPGYSTVGISLNVQHTAATPVGLNVIARSELIEVDGRRLVFKVEAFDDREQVGRGTHERFIIQMDKFLKKAELKASK
ncbi:MAG: thioesterase [Firmicutes bacterium]|nr:thioesterase [Bacillota bacterium]